MALHQFGACTEWYRPRLLLGDKICGDRKARKMAEKLGLIPEGVG